MKTSSPSSPPTSEPSAAQLAAWLGVQRRRADEFVAAQQARLQQIEGVVEGELRRLEATLSAQGGEVDRLQAECEALSASLAEAESRLADAQQIAAQCADRPEQPEDEDGRRRHETASDEIRQLKNRNADLQQQLAQARSTATKLARQARESGALDWETEKQRVLIALEADFDEGGETRRDERLKIEEVLRNTDAIVAAKNREIQELKQRLDELDQRPATGASQPPAAARTADNDASLQEQQESLRQLQDEWRERLKQAEIELSLERAKIARQRAELEDQLRALANHSSDPTDDGNIHREPAAAGGRWLARLGLSAADREPSRHPQGQS